MRLPLRGSGFLLVLTLPFAAMAQSRSGAGGTEISGTILNARTGQPLAHTTVTLQSSAHLDTAGTALTDADGHFTLSHIAAGRYLLRAARRGYEPSTYQEHGAFSTALVTAPGLDVTGLRFELQPTASIYGTVTEDSGEPVAHAYVKLFRQDAESGRFLAVASANSNELGDYELQDLKEGTYMLCVTGHPWYAVNTTKPPTSDRPQSPLDVAYPNSYYSDAANPADATPIPLRGGDRTAIHFILHPTPAVHLRIVLPQSAGRGLQIGSLHQDVFGESASVDSALANVDQSGDQTVIEFGGVPPGQYHLDVTFAAIGKTEDVALDAAAGDTSLAFDEKPGLAEVTGKVSMEDGSPLPPSLTAILRPDSSEAQVLDSQIAPDGSFHIRSVPAGNYALHASSATGELAAGRLMADGATAKGSRLTISSAPVTVVATLLGGSSEIKGFVRSGDKAEAGAMVVLVPGGSDGDEARFRRAQSASDGSFILSNVIPGSYTVVAITDGWELNWAHTAAISRYLPLGVKIGVPRGAHIALPAAVSAQSR